MTAPWFEQALKPINQQARKLAEQRQSELTKPLGALARLETLAIDFAGWQGVEKPVLDTVSTVVFAADHGIVEEGVSAFPQAVTVEMVRNFARGGAAVSVLSRENKSSLQVVNVGTVQSIESLAGVSQRIVASGTANFAHQPAMTEDQCLLALTVGKESVDKLINPNSQLFVGGEMGIGNTTSATAISCALLGLSPEQLTGAGTGLDSTGIKKKTDVITAALALHKSALQSPLSTLQYVGGFEIAALAGAYIAAAQKGIPSLVDGFITTAAALVACQIQPQLREWLLFSHQSAEQGHQLLLEKLEAEPILSLGMRLGEGSGALVALPILRTALHLHAEMATFAEAAVSEKI